MGKRTTKKHVHNKKNVNKKSLRSSKPITRVNKHRFVYTNIPIEHSSDSSEDSSEEEKEEMKKKKKVVKRVVRKKKDDDVDKYGNIKDLISYSEEDSNYESESDEYSEEEDDFMNPMKIIFGSSLFGGLKGGGDPKKTELKTQIQKSKANTVLKTKLLEKLNKTNLDDKQFDWFKTLLSIPFGVTTPLPIDIKKDNVPEYFKNLIKKLDDSIYGLKNVKEEIINFIAQTLTSSNTPNPRVLALHGVAGTGKTKIVRDGISKTLNRPMQTFCMGGSKDSSYFSGFEYTYMNSRHGAIVQALIDSKTMDPIFFLDELDKISGTPNGDEIENLLIHLTDPVQNHDFKDKYFYEFPIDLSKVIFIFAFNDITKIHPVLKDRLHIIHITPATKEEKLIIAKDYLIDELLRNIGITKKDFTITDDALKYIIDNYSHDDGGVRNIKRCIESLLLKINTVKLLGKDINEIRLSFVPENTTFPLVVNEKNIQIFLKSHESNEDKDRNCYHMYM